jgi:hypothetical protein
MVICEFGGVKLLSTILASVVISNKEVVARELHFGVFTLDLHIMQQSDHGGHSDRKRDAPDLAIIDLDDLDLLLEEHSDCPSPGDHLQGLIGCVQK